MRDIAKENLKSKAITKLKFVSLDKNSREIYETRLKTNSTTNKTFLLSELEKMLLKACK